MSESGHMNSLNLDRYNSNATCDVGSLLLSQNKENVDIVLKAKKVWQEFDLNCDHMFHRLEKKELKLSRCIEGLCNLQFNMPREIPQKVSTIYLNSSTKSTRGREAKKRRTHRRTQRHRVEMKCWRWMCLSMLMVLRMKRRWGHYWKIVWGNMLKWDFHRVLTQNGYDNFCPVTILPNVDDGNNWKPLLNILCDIFEITFCIFREWEQFILWGNSFMSDTNAYILIKAKF